MHSVALLGSGVVSGPVFVEDKLLRVPVPDWVHPSGFTTLPSSSLTHLLRFIRDPDLPENAKNMVLKVLDKAHPRPIAPQRWSLVLSAILERHGYVDREELMTELRDAARAAWCLVNSDSSPDRPFEANVRQQINETVTEDLLGPSWRREPTIAEATDAGGQPHTGADPEEAFLERIDPEAREAFFATLAEKLSPRERELLTAIREGVEPRTWGRQNGVVDSTVDVMMHRIRQKGRKLLRP